MSPSPGRAGGVSLEVRPSCDLSLAGKGEPDKGCVKDLVRYSSFHSVICWLRKSPTRCSLRPRFPQTSKMWSRQVCRQPLSLYLSLPLGYLVGP